MPNLIDIKRMSVLCTFITLFSIHKQVDFFRVIQSKAPSNQSKKHIHAVKMCVYVSFSSSFH